MSSTNEIIKDILGQLFKDVDEGTIESNQTLNALSDTDWEQYIESLGCDLATVDQEYLAAVIMGVAYTVDKLHKGLVNEP